MERTCPLGHEPALAEPSQHAELMISLGPAMQWGTARGLVPADQAHHLVTTSGILGSLVAGIGGAVLTVRTAPGFTALAYAELALALIAAALIAACSRPRAGPAGERQKVPQALPHLPESSRGNRASPRSAAGQPHR